jgi:hypothetical protein
LRRSRRLRLELTEQARQGKVSVGELLTWLVLAARDAGWQFNGQASAEVPKPEFAVHRHVDNNTLI